MTMEYILYMVVMAGVTYLIRVLPLAAFQKEIKNTFVRSFLFYVPYAVLGAMTFPVIIYSTNYIYSAIGGTVVAIYMAWKDKSLITVALSAVLVVLLIEGAVVWL